MAPALVALTPSISKPGSCSRRSRTPQVKAPWLPPPCSARLATFVSGITARLSCQCRILRNSGGACSDGWNLMSFDQIPIRTPAEAIDQEIDEHTYFQRKMPRLGIDRVDRNLGRLVAREDGCKASLLKIGSRDEGGKQRNPASLHRRIPQHLGIVGAQRPRNCNPVVAVRTGELPLVAGGKVAIGQALVIAQIVGVLRRAVVRKISRTRADGAVRWRDLARDHVRRR